MPPVDRYDPELDVFISHVEVEHSWTKAPLHSIKFLGHLCCVWYLHCPYFITKRDQIDGEVSVDDAPSPKDVNVLAETEVKQDAEN
jgi:hypothetical protein